jgi:hypothetical protein
MSAARDEMTDPKPMSGCSESDYSVIDAVQNISPPQFDVFVAWFDGVSANRSTGVT